MKSFIQFTKTIKVNSKNKTSVFTAGDVVTEAKVLRVCGYIPTNSRRVTEMEATIIKCNSRIAYDNKHFDFETLTTEEADKVALVTEYLLSLGFTRDSFAFGKGPSAVWDKGGDTVWVGIKMETVADAFIGHNGKRVSFTNNNYISINTFLSRVEKNGQLFG